MEELKKNIAQAVTDWLQESSVKTEEDARQLAWIQGKKFSLEESNPQPNVFLPPPGLNEDDE